MTSSVFRSVDSIVKSIKRVRHLDSRLRYRFHISTGRNLRGLPPEMSRKVHSSSTKEASLGSNFGPVCNFCRVCGASMIFQTPIGEDRGRHACSKCNHVEYFNPKMVVGCIIVDPQGRILLARRGIEPQLGLYTIPAGFLELGESAAEGAKRECMEEVAAEVELDAPYCQFDIPGIGQVYTLFRGKLAPPYSFRAIEPETLEAGLFKLSEIPWNELAFSSVRLALEQYVEDVEKGSFSMLHGKIVKSAGAGPNEPGTFELTDKLRFEVVKTADT